MSYSKALRSPRDVFRDWKIDYALYGADPPPGGRPPGYCYTNSSGQLECSQHPSSYYVGWGVVTIVVVAMFYSLVRGGAATGKEGTS